MQLPDLKAIVQYKPNQAPSDPMVITWDKMLQLGKTLISVFVFSLKG